MTVPTERERLIKELTELLLLETDTVKYRLLTRVIEFLKELRGVECPH
jgi:hypothetical protein